MATLRIPLAEALVLLIATMPAVAQQPSAAQKKALAATPATVTEAEAKAAAPLVPLGQQRRQSFERSRVLAGASNVGMLRPDLLAQCNQASTLDGRTRRQAPVASLLDDSYRLLRDDERGA
jgi:hypothetical protein